jgi:hypothetical protein
MVTSVSTRSSADAFQCGLADPEQDSAGEGDSQLARLAVHADARSRILVRRVVVGHALAAQAHGRGLQHQAERCVPLPQLGHLCGAQDARVGVRQHARFEGDSTRLHQVLGGRAQAAMLEPLAVGSIGDLRLVAETEERLDAAGAQGAAHHLPHVPERVGPGLRRVRRDRERAVGAAVAAEVGERDEHVPRHAHRVSLAAALALVCALEHGLAHALFG